MGGSIKAVLTGEFIALNAYIRKEEISRINRLLPEETRKKSKSKKAEEKK